MTRRWDQGYKDALGVEVIDCTAGGAPAFRSYGSYQRLAGDFRSTRSQSFHNRLLTGRSCASSELGTRRPFCCSGLEFIPFPLSDVIELLTLLDGVTRCSWLAALSTSLLRAFALCNDDAEAATPLGTSLALCDLSAFFLLLNRNAIVPFEASSSSHYLNAL